MSAESRRRSESEVRLTDLEFRQKRIEFEIRQAETLAEIARRNEERARGSAITGEHRHAAIRNVRRLRKEHEANAVYWRRQLEAVLGEIAVEEVMES